MNGNLWRLFLTSGKIKVRCTAAFRIVLCALFSVLFTLKTAAQESTRTGGGYAVSNQVFQAGYASQLYDATNGLPTSDANCVLGSSDGFIWIGSYAGVIRYDGTAFERLPTSFGLTSGRTIFEDSRKRVWVGTNDNGVVVLYDEKSRHYTFRDGLPSSSIRIFAEDGAGNVFIGTTSGLAYVDTDDKLHPLLDDRINEERILRLSSDSRGRIYGQSKNGIVFAIDDCKVTQVYTSAQLGMDKITTLVADPYNPGRVYLCTEGSEVYYGDFGLRASSMKKIDTSPLKNIHWISWDCGRVWISSSTMAGYLDEDYSFRELKNIPVNSAIEMTTSDYQGNIWMASSTQGVMKIVTNNFVDLSQRSGLKKQTVNGVCIHDGKFYIGTDRGLQIADKKYNPIKEDIIDYIGNSRIRSITEDREGNLWFAVYTNNRGLVCLKKDGTILSFTTENGLLNNQVRCVCIARNGSILVGTNGGLAVIKDWKVVKTYGSSQGIRNTEFLTVMEGEDGKIYCGSDGDGIYVISSTGIRKISRYEGLTSDVVMRIKKDPYRDIYWIVTSNSIQYIKDGIVCSVNSFPYNNNYDLYFNSRGELWILSSYGVYAVKAEDLLSDSVKDYRLFTIANGLPYSITSNSYSTMDDDGNLFISGREGVIRVNINHYLEVNTQVKVGISSVYCDEEKISANTDGTYTLPASTGRIKLSIAVMDYSMSNPLLRVFLEGSSDNGMTARKNEISALEYTGLSYGNYVLHIQILDNARRNVLMEKCFDITKKPRIIELLFVRILALTVFALAAGFVVWRIMKITVIRRQYDEIRRAKDDAERAGTAKSRFLSNMSQEILTPINTIMGMNEMIMREDARAVPKTYFMSIMNYSFDIRSATESLLALVSDLLEMTRIETGSLQIIQQEYEVQDLLRSVIIPVRSRCTEKKLKLNVSIDEMIPRRLYGDVGKIRQIMHRLLSNAVNYTDEGSIELKLYMESRTDDICSLCFTVKDTGIEISPEDAGALFSTYGSYDEEVSSHVRSGLGLDVSRKFAELMGGLLVCNTTYREGAEFIFTLDQKSVDSSPLGNFLEQDDGSAARGPYIPQFIAPDADVLAADTSPMNLNVMRNLLKATKVFVTTASAAEEVLEKIRTSTFNIAFIDQTVLDSSEENLIGKIREIAPALPVYVITENSITSEHEYKAMGFTGCFSNPVDGMFLERIVMRHLPQQMMEKPTKSVFIEELKEIPENLLWLNNVEGLSVQDGIKSSGGIGGLLFGIGLFHETIDENTAAIEKAYREGNFRLFEMKVSLMKNSARLIGALKVMDLATRMEEACKRNDRIYIASHVDELLECYGEFKEKLSAIRG